jgi:lipid-A-disaccharide synthase-like uncharacterized protein
VHGFPVSLRAWDNAEVSNFFKKAMVSIKTASKQAYVIKREHHQNGSKIGSSKCECVGTFILSTKAGTDTQWSHSEEVNRESKVVHFWHISYTGKTMIVVFIS